jgi:hypothetical protein
MSLDTLIAGLSKSDDGGNGTAPTDRPAPAGQADRTNRGLLNTADKSGEIAEIVVAQSDLGGEIVETSVAQQGPGGLNRPDFARTKKSLRHIVVRAVRPVRAVFNNVWAEEENEGYGCSITENGCPITENSRKFATPMDIPKK